MDDARLAEALSAQETYDQAVDRVLAQVDRLDAAAVRRAMELLTEARRRIIARLAELPGDVFEAAFLRSLQGEVEAQMGRYARDYAAFLTDQSAEWWALGQAFVDRPVSAIGLTAVVECLPSLEPRLVDILQDYRASLITGMSDEAINKITRELQLGVLSGTSPYQIQRAISDILRTQLSPAGVFHGIAARAEAITRTELNRVLSLATQHRQTQLQQRMTQMFPDAAPIRKQWLNAGDDRVRDAHKRPSLLAQRPALDEDFVLVLDGVEYRAAGPHDARLPAALSINCRCRAVTDAESVLAAMGQ